ncbi:hypothetical protein [Streptomyces avicenniae]|uniref:hypothetical protein n=1 Tax=Streptomyces avicenniae TaxID=500153 RepID=UPI00167CC1B7|nr:hypothetical protein [Streptomyces avicenniae]
MTQKVNRPLVHGDMDRQEPHPTEVSRMRARWQLSATDGGNPQDDSNSGNKHGGGGSDEGGNTNDGQNPADGKK